MVNMKSVYIFEGIDNVCITRALPFCRYESHRGVFYKGEVKHRGIFGKKVEVQNISDVYLTEPKKLLVGKKFMEGWQVIKVKMDFATKEPCIGDVNPSFEAKIHTLENELAIWKKKYYDAVSNNHTIEGKDRFDEEMKRRAKVNNDVKNLMFGYGGGFDGGFGNRFGLPGSFNSFPPQGGSE